MTTPLVTTSHDASHNRLTEIDEPQSQGGTTVTFAYDANGHRDQKTVATGGSNPTTYQVTDTYQSGRLASQSTLGGTLLATFTYDPSGIPESVVVGTDPNNSPRYYYVYNGHGDVVALTDASGNLVASYSYDVWGNLTASSENIPNANGWTNPYRYDGKDGVRYDLETGLYWLSTRAYDPTLGRFLQRDPLGRAPLFFPDQPYAYAGNNPLVNTDPSGELIYRAEGVSAAQLARVLPVMRRVARIVPWQPVSGCRTSCGSKRYGSPAAVILGGCGAGWTRLCTLGYTIGRDPPPPDKIVKARQDAQAAVAAFKNLYQKLGDLVAPLELSGLWPIIVATVPIAQTFVSMLLSTRKAAQLLGNAFAWQAKWADSMWTVSNVVLFQAGLDALLDFGDDLETVIGAGIVVLAPLLAKFSGAGILLASLIQDFVGNKMILDYTNKEANDLS